VFKRRIVSLLASSLSIYIASGPIRSVSVRITERYPKPLSTQILQLPFVPVVALTQTDDVPALSLLQ
jgi:hypothetical protein